MRIGYNVDLEATASTADEVRWERIREQVILAEEVGLDGVFLPDYLLFHTSEDTYGVWESTPIAGAVAAVTERVDVGHSVLSALYRPPAITAKYALSMDELTGGRYVLGIGAGNSETEDYRMVGVTTDHRRSRLEEYLQIVRGLLKQGDVNVDGEYWSCQDGEVVLRGPRPDGPPIVVAAFGPKMMRTAARYADAWNGFSFRGHTFEVFSAMVDQLERACDEVGREPATLPRTLDLSVDLIGTIGDPGEGCLHGSIEQIAQTLRSYENKLGIEEVRCYAAGAGTAADRIRHVEALGSLRDLMSDA